MKTNRQSCSKLHLEEEWKEVALHWLKVRTTKTKHFSTTKHRCNDTMDLIDTNSMCTGRKHFYMIKHKTRCIFKPYFDTIAKSFESYLSYIVSYFAKLEGTMRNISCQRHWYIIPCYCYTRPSQPYCTKPLKLADRNLPTSFCWARWVGDEPNTNTGWLI